MSEFSGTYWKRLKPGDYVRITRRGYGRREGVLGDFRYQENGDWTWPDENGNPLLDPWWAGEGFIEWRAAA